MADTLAAYSEYFLPSFPLPPPSVSFYHFFLLSSLLPSLPPFFPNSPLRMLGVAICPVKIYICPVSFEGCSVAQWWNVNRSKWVGLREMLLKGNKLFWFALWPFALCPSSLEGGPVSWRCYRHLAAMGVEAAYCTRSRADHRGKLHFGDFLEHLHEP